MKDITGTQWRAMASRDFVILSKTTSVEDPTIPALFEAFSKVNGAKIWKEPDTMYSKAIRHFLGVSRDDGSYLIMHGALQPLKEAYAHDQKFLRTGEANNLPGFNNLYAHILRGGPRNIIRDNVSTLKKAFNQTVKDLEAGRKDLAIHRAELEVDGFAYTVRGNTSTPG